MKKVLERLIKRGKKSKFSFRLAFFVYLFSLMSCQERHSSSQFPKNSSEQVLHLSFHTEIRSLDPKIGIDFSVLAIKMLFEGLMCKGIEGKLQPAIALSYEVSPDLKTYVFHLRPSVWSNGEELTAYDFEYSWKRVINPDSKALGVHNFYPIKNVQAVVNGQMPLESVGIKALSEKTLQVDLEHPTPYFLEMTSLPSFFPINPRVDRQNPNWANLEGNGFVCNGPFVLTSHRLENELVLQKNPYYWDAEQIKLAKIEISIIKEPMTQLSLFEKNKLDWVGKPLSRIPLDAMESLKKKGLVTYFPNYGVYWFFLNVESFPFNNKKMRQAFAYAVNRKAITTYILQEAEKPALGLLPHSLALQEAPYFEDNNPELAKQLFKEALAEMHLQPSDLPEITINLASSSIHALVAQALQEQWNLVFGIPVKIEFQDWKSHYAKLQSGNFQIGGMGWQSWLSDPLYILQTFRDKSDGVNMSRWENAHYKELLDAAEEEPNEDKRRQYFHEAEKLAMDELPVIPLYFTTISYIKNKKLKNFYLSEVYGVDFRWAYFENDKP